MNPSTQLAIMASYIIYNDTDNLKKVGKGVFLKNSSINQTPATQLE